MLRAEGSIHIHRLMRNNLPSFHAAICHGDLSQDLLLYEMAGPPLAPHPKVAFIVTIAVFINGEILKECT